MENMQNRHNVLINEGLRERSFRLLDKALFLAIALSMLIFILYPISAVLLKSIYIDGQFTVRLYQELLSNKLEYLYNSFLVAVLSTLLTVLVSVCIALYESYSTNRLKRSIVPMLLLTMISPPFVSSLAFITLFGRRGFVTNTLLGLQVNPYGWQGIVTMEAFGEISITTLLIIGVLRGIDNKVVQASRDLGASSFETLKRVVLPLLMPGILVASFLAFVKSLADFGTPMVIGGNFKVLATEAYMMVIARGDLPKASVLSVLILIPALLAFWFYRRFMEDMSVSPNLATRSSKETEPDVDLRGLLGVGLSLITWTFFGLMALQFTTILLTAITRYGPDGYVFTTEFLVAFKYNKYQSFLRSLWYAFLSGVLTSFIGILLSYYVERRRIWGGKLLDLVATLPFIIPGTFFGLGYVLAFNGEPFFLTGTAAIVVLNCIFRQIPVASKAGSAVLSSVSPEIEDAAKDLGTPSIFILKDILLPMLKPAFLVSFVYTFTATMMTVGSIIFIISPKAKVATIDLFDALNQGSYGEAAVIANLLTIVTLIVNLVFARFMTNQDYGEGVANVPDTK
jgi:iron(III) transport system permease protein